MSSPCRNEERDYKINTTHTMKKILLLFLSLIVGTLASWAQLPEFSTADAPVYYKINFTQGGTYLQDNGEGTFLTNNNAANSGGQLFAFIGSQSSFQLLSKLGNYVTTGYGTAINNGQSTTLLKSGSEGKNFQILNSPSQSGKFVITTTDNTSVGFNTWGGAGAEHNIGFWDTKDVNDQIQFISAEDVPDYTELEKLIPVNYTQSGTKLTTWEPVNPMTLWYNIPTTLTTVSNKWMEYSLPIGNGHLGACLMGGVHTDEIQLNEKSLWTGTSTINPNPNHGKYMNLGSLYVIDESGDYATFANYKRWLDIEDGIGGVDFTDADGNAYARRYFASEPDNVIVAHYQAAEGKTLSFLVSFYPGTGINAKMPKYNEGEGYFTGSTDLLKYNTTFRVIPVGEDATVTADAVGVHVSGAQEVIVLLAAMTDYDGTNPATFSTGVGDEGLAAAIASTLDAAAKKSYSELENAHVENFRSYMSRVSLNLGTSTQLAASTKTTEDLIKYYNNSTANSKSAQGLFLEQLYFYYGRYLEISSSRGSLDVPSNLQGIWNNSASAPWNSDVHTNINIQMNYWPAEPTNLSDCHLPFLNYIVNMTQSPGWKLAAKNAGQSVGWTVHTESNIFGGMSSWMSNYTIANAWYVSHLWQHYRYTLDKEYLAKVFPAMWSCAQYWAERLKLASDGTYECPNEYSPEHGPGSQNATAHSQQLCRELFENTLEAIEVLGNESELDAEWLEKIKDRNAKLDLGLATETYTGNWGTSLINSNTQILREWKYSSYTSGENGHRHQSHLMCLYPFNQVYPGSEYFDAAVNSLKLRGDNSTGWSMGWRINLWARAQDGDHARTLLHNALKHSTSYGVDQSRGGIYYNLFDSHAPFQIDGNFGACAGIAEMLMQSATGTISILPALPGAWAQGSVKGLKAVGDFTVNIEWKDKKATFVSVVNNQGQPLRMTFPNVSLENGLITVNGASVTPESKEDGSILIPSSTAGDLIEIYVEKPVGISAVDAGTHQGDSTYDLAGRRAYNTQKGIFITNGKKEVIR